MESIPGLLKRLQIRAQLCTWSPNKLWRPITSHLTYRKTSLSGHQYTNQEIGWMHETNIRGGGKKQFTSSSNICPKGAGPGRVPPPPPTANPSFKLLRSPGFDSKEPILPGCAVQPCGPVRQPYSYSVPSSHRLFKNSSTADPLFSSSVFPSWL